jgi:dTMP kinase
MKRLDTGLLIAFEGIDGAGKTTQATILAKYLESFGVQVVSSKEPTNGPWGKAIRESATSRRMPLSEELRHFIEDRKEHVRELIAPALAKGKTVILDRYFYSTVAYQGARGNGVEQLIADMLEIAPVPDAVILLDIDPEIGRSRISNGRNETPNKFEQLSNLKKAREIFLRLAKSRTEVILIDGSRDIEATTKAIHSALIDTAFKKFFCAKNYGCDDPLYCEPRQSGTCTWARMKGYGPSASFRGFASQANQK